MAVVRINFTIDEDTLKVLDETADEMNMTRSGLITFFATFVNALNKNKPLNEVMSAMLSTLTKGKKRNV
jgi:hypothetical protein